MLDALAFTPEQFRDCYRQCVADVEPDDFRWEPLDVAALAEVGIFRDDQEAARTSMIPNLPISRCAKADVPDVGAVGKSWARIPTSF
jgi:hypothetical protein